jgi:hypothetical protein
MEPSKRLFLKLYDRAIKTKRFTDRCKKEYTDGYLQGYVHGYSAALSLPQLPSDDNLPQRYSNKLYVTHHYGQNQEDTWNTYEPICNNKDCHCSFTVYQLVESLEHEITSMVPKKPKLPTERNIFKYLDDCNDMALDRSLLIDLLLFIKRKRSTNSPKKSCIMPLIDEKIKEYNDNCTGFVKIDPEFYFFDHHPDE